MLDATCDVSCHSHCLVFVLLLRVQCQSPTPLSVIETWAQKCKTLSSSFHDANLKLTQVVTTLRSSINPTAQSLTCESVSGMKCYHLLDLPNEDWAFSPLFDGGP